jgi:hypothetical protein
MNPTQSHNHTPDGRIDRDPSSEVIEQLEAIRAAIAEAEDLGADFAIEMYLEAKRLSNKWGSHTKTPWLTNLNGNR